MRESEKFDHDPMTPHLARLRHDLDYRRVTGQIMPVSILVPAGFLNASSRLAYWGLPVVEDDVAEPSLALPRPVVQRPLSFSEEHPPVQADYSRGFRRVDVFVAGDHSEYHADRDCAASSSGSGLDGVLLAKCEDAHRSSLLPCSRCGTEIAARMTKVFGPVTDQVKARRRPPALRSAASSRPSEAAAADNQGFPYGAPSRPDDPRFTNLSSLGWGKASFASDPSEWLGEPSDDDHDWRGAGS